MNPAGKNKASNLINFRSNKTFIFYLLVWSKIYHACKYLFSRILSDCAKIHPADSRNYPRMYFYWICFSDESFLRHFPENKNHLKSNLKVPPNKLWYRNGCRKKTSIELIFIIFLFYLLHELINCENNFALIKVDELITTACYIKMFSFLH